MKRYLYWSFVFISCSLVGLAQQLPFYTQHNSNGFLINPGSTGSKRMLDARINYRQQWAGFEGAPRTLSVGINSRLAKGKMGAGFSLIKDESGPIKKLSFGGSYSIHLLFND